MWSKCRLLSDSCRPVLPPWCRHFCCFLASLHLWANTLLLDSQASLHLEAGMTESLQFASYIKVLCISDIYLCWFNQVWFGFVFKIAFYILIYFLIAIFPWFIIYIICDKIYKKKEKINKKANFVLFLSWQTDKKRKLNFNWPLLTVGYFFGNYSTWHSSWGSVGTVFSTQAAVADWRLLGLTSCNVNDLSSCWPFSDHLNVII